MPVPTFRPALHPGVDDVSGNSEVVIAQDGWYQFLICGSIDNLAVGGNIDGLIMPGPLVTVMSKEEMKCSFRLTTQPWGYAVVDNPNTNIQASAADIGGYPSLWDSHSILSPTFHTLIRECKSGDVLRTDGIIQEWHYMGRSRPRWYVSLTATEGGN